MKYWILSNMGDIDGSRKQPLQLLPRLSLAEEWELSVGREISRRSPVEFQVVDGDVPEDMPWSGDAVFVGSERLRKILEVELPGHAQFLKASLLRSDGIQYEENSYWILNWLKVLDCVNKESSEFDVIPDPSDPDGFSYSIRRLVLDERVIPVEAQIFRIRHYESTVIATEVAKRVFLSNQVTGCQFYEIQ